MARGGLGKLQNSSSTGNLLTGPAALEMRVNCFRCRKHFSNIHCIHSTTPHMETELKNIEPCRRVGLKIWLDAIAIDLIGWTRLISFWFIGRKRLLESAISEGLFEDEL